MRLCFGTKECNNSSICRNCPDEIKCKKVKPKKKKKKKNLSPKWKNIENDN